MENDVLKKDGQNILRFSLKKYLNQIGNLDKQLEIVKLELKTKILFNIVQVFVLKNEFLI